MKIKTHNLTGPALDWAVAKCEGYPMGIWYDEDGLPMVRDDEVPEWKPSANWSQGGPIIEREKINLERGNPLYFPQGNERGDFYEPLWIAGKQHGQTPLIAAMRCYVASKMGDAVEIPADLI